MPATIDLAALQDAVETHVREAGAEFGVYIRHVQTGATVEVSGGELYLLASVFKVPLLIEALAQVDEGKLRLDERIELRR
ncbi:MAG: serine hydrolase [Chloroflexota bacterium]